MTTKKPDSAPKNVDYYQNAGGTPEHDDAARERNRDSQQTEESAKSVSDKVADVAHDVANKIKHAFKR